VGREGRVRKRRETPDDIAAGKGPKVKRQSSINTSFGAMLRFDVETKSKWIRWTYEWM
jgi:hypothetical protein